MQQGLLPLFPLEVVLMPGGHLPLHIFEERYKEMIGEALRDKTEFGVVLANANGMTETGCTATIEGVLHEYPDGRLDIVTLGRRRFEILLVNEERNFLRGAVEFFDDEQNALPAAPEDLAAAIRAYNELQTIWKNQPFEEAGYADPRASFRLVRAVRDLGLRQSLLKSRNEAERMRKLAVYLAEFAQRVQHEQLAKDNAPRNGHGYLNGTASTNMATLIFDADDTLWENNIYFERAFDRFVDFLAHSDLTAVQIRDVLNEIEIVNAKTHGYGSLNFGRNLQQAYQHLAQRAIAPDDLNLVMAFAEEILEQPIELLPDVDKTLAALSARHDLALFTKGHPEEQRIKVDRSGLAQYFSHTGIVKEKDPAAYERLTEEQGFEKGDSWMIGNSPKSDINPALQVGLGAVLVPHERTWVLERCDIAVPSGSVFFRVEKFKDLGRFF